MTEELVTLETAKLLKKKGFNERTLFAYKIMEIYTKTLIGLNRVIIHFQFQNYVKISIHVQILFHVTNVR